MGLKSPQLSLLFDSGMEHGQLFRDSLAMVLKTDHPVQPNGSPLLSPPMKQQNDVFGSSNGCSRPQPPQLMPLRVDVNGFKQYSMLSPLDGQPSSLVSSALPTPLLDLESNSNCSDSAVPHGDLYPAVFAAANASFRPHIDVRSPGTLPPGAFAFSTHNYKPSLAKATPPLLAKRPVDLNKKVLCDKVTRHKPDLKFMIPKSGSAYPHQLASMLKRVRKMTDLPKAIDAALFEDEVVESVVETARSADQRTVDEDMTDYSDLEDTDEVISVPYKKIREDEERARFAFEDAQISFAVQEKLRFRDQLVRKLESSIAHDELVVDTSPTHCCARARPYTRQSNRKLIRFDRFVDYSKMLPSTSSSSDDGPKKSLATAVHWASMVPPFTTRRSLNHSVHSIDGQDLQEECMRNGWTRRAEKEEKRRQREEALAGKHRDSSDYEDTDQSDSEYNPKNTPAPKKTEKKKGRGRPPRDKSESATALAKAGRRQSQFSSKSYNDNFYDGIIEFTANTLTLDIPQYQEIRVPDVVVDHKVVACETGECHHTFDDLGAELRNYHDMMEQEEKARFKTKESRRGAPQRETSMDESCWAESPGSKASPSCRPPA